MKKILIGLLISTILLDLCVVYQTLNLTQEVKDYEVLIKDYNKQIKSLKNSIDDLKETQEEISQKLDD